MTDRELLELAAKAAGMNMSGWRWYDHPAPGAFVWCYEGATTANKWNPLTDDGDALRLAVRLHLKILIGEAWTVDPITGKHRKMFRVSPDDEPCQYAATRRAIVRAAAELQRQKENK